MITNLQDSSAFADRLPIFGTPAYLTSRSPEFGWLADENYAMAYFVDRRLIFRRMVLASEPIPLRATTPASYAPFIEEASRFVARSLDVDLIAKSQANVVLASYPQGSEAVEWGSYRLDLARFDDDEGLMRIIDSKHRNVIRKAMKDGVVIGQTSSLDEVYRCLRDTFERQGELLFPSREFLARLRDNLGEQVLWFKAEFEGQLQGVAVVPFNQEAGYYYYGGSCARPYAGSLNLMHYEIMKFLKARGVKLYDFMGARIHVEKDSKFEGIQRFKSRFGGELIQGYMFRQVLNPLKHRMFDMTVRLDYRSKGMRYPGEFIDQARARR